MPAPPRTTRYAWYVVGVLLLLNVSSFVDRQVMALMVTPIKADLGLTDTEMSLILGTAFAIPFSLAVFVVGRLVDRGNRRTIIVIGVAIWSVMCTMSGVVNTFGQLFAARVGVGVGEATLSPTAYSLIPDYFPPERLSTALSVFTSGVFLGSGLAYLIGGAIIQAVQHMDPWTLPVFGEIRPWQRVFILVGVPGIALTLLALTVREPRSEKSAIKVRVWSAGEVTAWLRRHAVAYVTFAIGISVYAVVNFGTAYWFPAYFERVHGWEPGKVGVIMGGATMVFGVLGVLAGGRLADWLKSRGRRDGNLIVLILSAIVSAAAAIPLFLPPSERVMILGIIITNIAAASPFGAAAAAATEMSPAPMRGQAAAILVFLLNFIGLGFGPTLVALITDKVLGDPLKVGLSLLIVTLVGRFLAALAVWIGLGAHRRAVTEVTSAA